MSQAEFYRVLPSCLGFLPKKAIEYLERAAKQPTSDLTAQDAISYAKIGAGDIYLGIYEGELCGAAFFLYGQGNNGKILDVALLSGVKFMKYRKKAMEFLINTAKSKDCKEVWVMGRREWGRVLPEMVPIGVIYCLPVK